MLTSYFRQENIMSRAYRTAPEWQALITAWQSSDLSARTFCGQQGIGYASFCQWRQRLRPPETPQPAFLSEAPHTSNPATFIDLGALSPPATGDGQGWRIVLSLGNGVELRLSQG